MMKILKKNPHEGNLILGIFLMLYATNGYLIFGEIGKFTCLILGVFFILRSVLISKSAPIGFFLLLKSFIYFMILLFISFVLNQQTVTTTNILFDLVCFSLFVLGACVGEWKITHLEISKKLKILMCLLIIYGNYMFYAIQFSFVSGNAISREFADETLNPIGVAYAQAQLFFLFFFMLKNETNLLLRFLNLGSLLSIVLVIIITESRGPVVFLILSLIFIYFKKIKIIFSKKSILTISILFLIFSFVFSRNHLIRSKVETTVDRFELAFNFLSNKNNTDSSLRDRQNLQNVFFENYDQMYLGYENYKPYPHNQFIEIFMRFGFFGLPLYVLSITSFINCVKLISRDKTLKDSIGYLIMIVFLFTYLQSMSSLTLDNNRMMWFGFGFLLTFYKNSKKKPTIKIPVEKS